MSHYFCMQSDTARCLC